MREFILITILFLNVSCFSQVSTTIMPGEEDIKYDNLIEALGKISNSLNYSSLFSDSTEKIFLQITIDSTRTVSELQILRNDNKRLIDIFNQHLFGLELIINDYYNPHEFTQIIYPIELNKEYFNDWIDELNEKKIQIENKSHQLIISITSLTDGLNTFSLNINDTINFYNGTEKIELNNNLLLMINMNEYQTKNKIIRTFNWSVLSSDKNAMLYSVKEVDLNLNTWFNTIREGNKGTNKYFELNGFVKPYVTFAKNK